MQIETSIWTSIKDANEEIVMRTTLDEDAEIYVDNSMTV